MHMPSVRRINVLKKAVWTNGRFVHETYFGTSFGTIAVCFDTSLEHNITSCLLVTNTTFFPTDVTLILLISCFKNLYL